MIAQNSVVTLHYTVVDNATQEVLDSSEGQEPLRYLHGAEGMIPGFQEALLGKEAGDDVEFVLEPSKAYGEYDPENVRDVPRQAFEGIDNPQVGMPITAEMEQGTLEFTISNVTDDTITLDGNHPLAGKHLKFNVKVEDVREASAEELDHGHVH